MNRFSKLNPGALLVGALALIGCGGVPDSENEFDDEAPEEMIEEGMIEEGEDMIGDAAETEADPSEADDSEPEAALVAWCNDVQNWSATWAGHEQQVLTKINQKRAAGATCGGTWYPPAPALTLDTRLRCAARKHSKDMGVKDFFSHTGSNGSTPWDRIKKSGYTYTQAAENIAWGYTTPSDVVKGWMASPGHCTNIMNKTLKHLGVGYYAAPGSSYKHLWSQSFGKP
jgi:uncharacterized protein YkwD